MDDLSKWHVYIITINKSVRVCAQKFLMFERIEYGARFVHPPSWWELLIGRTFRSKIDKAVSEVQSICDQINKQDEAVEKLMNTSAN